MNDQMKVELQKGLKSRPVYIPAWYRYDEEGSRLNDVCLEQCKWYYFHRFEVKLLTDVLDEINDCVKESSMLVDLGSGNPYKTRLIIDQLLSTHERVTYVPVDISQDYLNKTAEDIKAIYGNKLDVKPIGEEYITALKDISLSTTTDRKLIVWFGSLQNLPYETQVDYLTEIRNTMRGYNEQFHLSSIRRLSREMGGNIDSSNFEIKNELVVNSSDSQCSYINIWMEARHNCVFDISKLDLTVRFEKGDKLYFHEEGGISCKYTIEQIRHLLNKASLEIVDFWVNEHVAAVVVSRR
ncbi:unnamed protein product [Mytilus coruscus]|uniref:Histidine-specific methyltransferase SAM-dependent domain-containing protein n=1 Tax=Mytilus coruscus TaxID=42192 RepID=A0A6J8BUK4_MYTCO|nr:unnamed protein product [Mytilus coruscus]